MLKKVLPWFFLAFILSCSGLPSGRYIQLKKNSSPEDLAKMLNTKSSDIKLVNENKRFIAGEWIFIPKKIGFISALEDYLPRDGSLPSRYLRGEKLLWPVPQSLKISSRFGPRGRRHHDGIDIPAPHGTHFFAVQSGKVIYSGNGLRGYGNLTIIEHEKGFFSVYAHAQKNKTNQGQRVSKGEVIGTIGSTGRSTGPHLHFELRVGQKSIDPTAYLESSRRQMLADRD